MRVLARTLSIAGVLALVGSGWTQSPGASSVLGSSAGIQLVSADQTNDRSYSLPPMGVFAGTAIDGVAEQAKVGSLRQRLARITSKLSAASSSPVTEPASAGGLAFLFGTAAMVIRKRRHHK